nr:unnamed protein product [Callosobruchus chinensis]
MNVGKVILLNLQLLEFFGIIYTNSNNRISTTSKYIRSAFFVGFWFFTMFISELINLVLVVDNLADLVSASFLFLTHLVHLIKYIHIYKYTSRIRQLVVYVDRKNFKPKSKHQEIILEEVLTLPLAGWFPFNPNDTPMFQTAFTYQIIGATINGLTNISIDTFMSDCHRYQC